MRSRSILIIATAWAVCGAGCGGQKTVLYVPPSVSIDNTTVAEGDAGTALATFTVTLSDADASPVSVTYASGDLSARAGFDCQAAEGSVVIAPGEVEATLTVVVLGDLTDEGDETFQVTLASAEGATLGVATGTATITDDEESVAFLNFQPTLLKILSSGLAAMGTASQGATIPPIVITASVSGGGGLSGTVAQSAGANEDLSLFVTLDGYSDTGDVAFQTDNSSDLTKLQFGLEIRNQPFDNQMTGDIDGSLTLSGDVVGIGVFGLHTVSDLEDDDLAPNLICTHVTGTVAAAGTSLAMDFVLPLGLDSALQAVCTGL